MFKKIKEKYNYDQNKIEYLKNVHSNIMKFKEIGYLLKDSDIEEIGFTEKNVFIKLNSLFNNLKMSVDDYDFEEVPMSLISFGKYEVEETNMVKTILSKLNKNNFVFLDIGANLGWYSLNVLKNFSNAIIYAFEPSPETYKRLQNNFKLNCFDTNSIFNIGLFNEEGQMDFFYDIAGSGASSLKDIRGRDTVKKIQVNVEKLDDWCQKNKIQDIDFIKCDVEGAEYFVFQGGKNYIEKCQPIVFSEMLRKWSAKFNYHPNNIINFFNDLNYNCYIIKDKRLKKIKEITEETLETNYFFLNKEKHNFLIKELER